MLGKHQTRKQKRRFGLVAVSLLLLGIGSATLTAAAVDPQAIETVWGSARAVMVTAPLALSGDLPEVTLGASGTAADLDLCDGTFTEMVDYDAEGVPPVWAAHNKCGGDVILPWSVGQHLVIDSQEYEVVDMMTVPKFTSTVDDVAGLEGMLALQTCLYGDPQIRFVGVAPVE